MSENLALPGNADLGNMDPTQRGNPEGTIATLTAEQRQKLAYNMDPRNEGYRGGAEVTLQPGKTLERQCNANYDYLNSKGVSMAQFVGAVNELRIRTADREVGDAAQGGLQNYGRVISHTFNPLTGEVAPSDSFGIDYDADGNSVLMDMTGVEADMIGVGVFSKPAALSLGTCRADQILYALKMSPDGRDILEAVGIGDPNQRPEQPIALVEEPTPIAEPQPEEVPQSVEVPTSEAPEAASPGVHNDRRRTLGSQIMRRMGMRRSN